MPHTALFIIDVQKGLAASSTEIPHASRIRDATRTILDRARQSAASSEASNPDILIVQHEEPRESGDLVRGSKPWEVVYSPREGERLVGKTTGDTFESNPHLATQLHARGVRTIVLCGIQSEYCVRSTALGGLAAGFEVVLLQGAHSTYDDDSGSGRSASHIERDVDEELRSRGVVLQPWEEWLSMDS